MINTNIRSITRLVVSVSISWLIQGTLPQLMAQESAAPFSRILLTMETGSKFGQSGIDQNWATGIPASLALRMPFYFGKVEGGLQQLNFQARHDSNPNFKSQYIFLGWRIQHSIWNNLSLGLGVRLGNQFMTFEGAYDYAEQESELGTELYGALNYQVMQNWIAEFSIRHQRIYTRHHIKLQFVTVSIGREFNTPHWLVEILE